MVNDPVEQGFVASLAHPGGNITGFTFVDFPLIGKWLEMLKEIASGVRRVALGRSKYSCTSEFRRGRGRGHSYITHEHPRVPRYYPKSPRAGHK